MTRYVVSGIFFVTLGVSLALSGCSTAPADDSFFGWMFSLKRMKGVAPVRDEIYLDECGACHMPYQPGLLPARSWHKLLDAKALADHFGENAELDEETRRHLLAFASAHAADTSYYKRSRKVMASLAEDQTPLRITEVPYIREKHREIPAALITANPQVKSLSFCNRCHRKADAGIYDDDTVVIPGHGRWDD